MLRSRGTAPGHPVPAGADAGCYRAGTPFRMAA
jgi:hypothetical protein